MRWEWALGAATVVAMLVRPSLAQTYEERYRPQFHFTSAKNWTNDPNGLVYFDGEYHLFFQYNPFGDQWGHMSWGHAVSDDLVHWTELGVAIPEEDGVMAFSGSAVVDRENTSGWGKDGKPPLVAVYTGHRPSDGHQFQRVAYSNDRGRTWARYGTVIDIGAKDFRDPKVFWYAPKHRWTMVVSLPPQHRIRIYHSANLRDWTLDSEFGPAGCVDGAWECPDLFPLKVEGGGGTKWVMTMSVSGGAPAGGSGVQYVVGEFDGERFVADPQKTGWLDHGPDCYAAVTWSDLPAMDGRRVVLGWMTNLRYAGAMPTSPWRGGMTLPRELTLVKGPEGFELAQRPVRELERLRGAHWAVRPGKASDVNEQLRGTAAVGGPGEIAVEFDPADARRFGIDVCVGDGRRTRIGYDVGRGEVFVDRTQSGDVAFQREFPTVSRAAVPVRDGRVRLKIWVDASSVEVFTDGGWEAITQLVYPPEGARGVDVWSEGGEAKVVRLEGWAMRSIWK